MLLLAASGLALTLAGCKVDNRPLLARNSAQPVDYAALPQPGLPGAEPYGADAYGGNLPPPPPPLPPARAYPYAERAYGLDRAFYQEAPDYGFAYADEEPWVWQAADDSLMFAEPYGDDYRFYYYEPGATYPYFVRTSDYGYAYDRTGGLLALFDAAGALIRGDNYARYYPDARRYWSRGSDLRATYARAPRRAIDPGVWTERAPRIARIEQPWMAAPERQPAWREWRASAGPAVVQRFERQRPARAIAAEGRTDNGRHLGWDQGRHEGWNNRPAAGPMIAQAAPPRSEAARGPNRDARRGPEGHGRRQGAEAAAAAMAHGRDASFRGGEPRAAQRQSQPQPSQPNPGRGEGHGRHGGGNPHFAQAAPQPSARAAPAANWTAAKDHGHGHGAPRPQPQGQPQAQPNHGGGGGHDNGGGHGGGDKHGDHGHGH